MILCYSLIDDNVPTQYDVTHPPIGLNYIGTPMSTGQNEQRTIKNGEWGFMVCEPQVGKRHYK